MTAKRDTPSIENTKALQALLSRLARWEQSKRLYQELCAEANARKAPKL